MSFNIGILNGTTTIKKLKPYIAYPDTPSMEVEYTDTNTGNTYVGFIENSELALIETIQSLKLNPSDLEKLAAAIEKYGEQQYFNGGFNESTDESL